jgi:hypothetical protein
MKQLTSNIAAVSHWVTMNRMRPAVLAMPMIVLLIAMSQSINGHRCTVETKQKLNPHVDRSFCER